MAPSPFKVFFRHFTAFYREKQANGRKLTRVASPAPAVLRRGRLTVSARRAGKESAKVKKQYVFLFILFT
jgi:hypothetical protein